MRLEEVAERLECSASKISRLETGKGIPRTRDVRDMIGIYGVTDTRIRDRLIRWAREGQQQGWWEQYSDVLKAGALRSDHLGTYIALEADATTVRVFQLGVVPGLLQTRTYAKAVLAETAAIRSMDEHEIDRLVELRMRRQDALQRSTEPLLLRCILDEGVLRRPVGGRHVMSGQLEALLDAAERPNITIQVLPFTSEVHPGLGGSFAVLEFTDSADHDRVYVETHLGSMYLEQQSDVTAYQQLFDDVSARAPSPAVTPELIAAQLASLNQP